MFGETTISYVKILNHPIETTIYKWVFRVPGMTYDPLKIEMKWKHLYVGSFFFNRSRFLKYERCSKMNIYII